MVNNHNASQLQSNTDVIVMGAGLVGLATAVAMTQRGYRVSIIDRKKPEIAHDSTWDSRIYALTVASVDWLKQLNVWSSLNLERICSIDGMRLYAPKSQQPLHLDAEVAHMENMGVILENRNLATAFMATLNPHDVNWITGIRPQKLQVDAGGVTIALADGSVVTGSLLIGADGGDSWVRTESNISVHKRHFYQVAIVANFKAEKPQARIAAQWFGEHETLAFLPMPDNMISMVWAARDAKINRSLEMSPLAFTQAVMERSCHWAGNLELVGDIVTYPLVQQNATRWVGPRTLLVGDAAHQVHPMAGQGVNIGFGDVRQLMEIATQLRRHERLSDVSVLRHYERSRKLEVLEMNMLTNGLDHLFALKRFNMPTWLAMGMDYLNRSEEIKKFLVKHATL